MNSRTTNRGRRSRPPLAALAAAAVGLGLTAVGAPGPAFGAGPTEVVYDQGGLDWGVKQSFRTYLEGPASDGGKIQTTGGATRNASGALHLGLGSGRYDLATHTLSAAFTGGVHFTAHRGALDITLDDFRLTTTGTTGTLTADTATRETPEGSTTPQIVNRQDVALVTFTVGRDTTAGGDTATALTADGAKVFAPFYPVGTVMDPLNLVLKSAAPASPSASAPASDAASPSAGASASTSASAGASASASASVSASAPVSPSASVSPGTPPAGARLPIVDGALNWGFKESFRSYLAGPAAQGRVEFGSGAADYRFAGGTGEYDTATHGVTAAFAGTVRFLGHPDASGGHQLDLAFARLGLKVDRTGAFLVADVTAKGMDGKTTTLTAVPVARLDLSKASFTPVKGVVTLADLPATLTEQGAPAFGGFYRAGAALDPVTVVLAFEKGAALPTGAPSTPATTAAPVPAGPGLTLTGATGYSTGGVLASTGTDTPFVPLLATATGLLLLGGGTTVLLRRRTARDS
ncbi:HtaA domain-containing protein [Kitasatospora sp. NPDC088346]|uniref:HtaA domain-containing protein n=1 Tax=Kitasatospora sp. NPDC088346 TaxID=3364073 RepID=UPI0037F30CE2